MRAISPRSVRPRPPRSTPRSGPSCRSKPGPVRCFPAPVWSGAGSSFQAGGMMPDIVILNGRLITMDGPDAEALAITGGRIEAVGTTAEIRAMAGDTRVLDAGGATVLPGFIDSHVHLFGGSVELGYLDLYGGADEDTLTARVRAWARQFTDDRIVFAVQADYGILGAGRNTTRHDL